MSTDLRLGPFRLTRMLGKGGMGAVWGGVHAREGIPVAVKVLHRKYTGHSWFLESFATEVRAVARLQHPNIVVVLDHGKVGHDAAGLAAHGVGPASPWLAMEQVPGESLGRAAKDLAWRDLRRVFRSLLEALAHAHARGVLHRDLKPGNVMVSSARVVLLDFGIARVADDPGHPGEDVDGGALVGTAAYMAPEQFTGRNALLGPWTDLYALGCTAWCALTGEPPFGRRRPLADLQRAHVFTELPRLQPRVPVPAGLEDWLRGLLHKDPTQRTQRAADAAWMLDQLSEPQEPTWSVSPDAETFRWGDSDVERTLVPEPEPKTRGPTQPPLPREWRPPRQSRPTQRLLGAGVRLFGLRAVPMVGRDEQQALLWDALHHAHAGQARAVLLQGPAGSGKSALASWLVERAHELGGAEVVTAQWSAGRSAGDGLGFALSRWLRCGGLSREQRLHQVNDAAIRLWLNGAETRDLQALVGAAEHRRFDSASDRHAAVVGVLTALSRRRPVILRLEDVHWGPDGLAFVLHALRRWSEQSARVLLVLTAREVLPTSTAGQLIDRLQRWPAAQRIEVGPLQPGYRGALIHELLQLDGELADQVEQRTGGNPLFITQLVGDWVQRGILLPGPQGFTLRPGAQPDLPDDLHAVWQMRVDRVLEGRGRLERRALELAAILGMRVDSGEWRRACRHAGAWSSPELVELLFTEGLIEPAADGGQRAFSFVHARLRESLVRSAEQSGWASAARRGCVAMLRDEQGGAGVALRLGRLLLALGDLDDAIAPLTEGAWEAVVDSEYLLAADALQQREDALQQLTLDPDDPRPCDGWIMSARVARRRGDVAAAAGWTAKAEAAARAQGWTERLVQALREQARVAQHEGRRRAALTALSEAVFHASTRADPVALAWCQRDLGLARVQAGAPKAAPHLAAASQTFAARGERFGQGTCELGRAAVCQRSGQLDAMATHLAAAQEAFAESLTRQEPAHAWVGLAEAAWLQGNIALAERHARSALARFRDLGSPPAPGVLLRLAGALLVRGETDEAEVLLRDQLRAVTEAGRLGLRPALYAHLGWLGAANGDAALARAGLEGCAQDRAFQGTADPLAAEAARRCAEVARRRGLPSVETLAQLHAGNLASPPQR